VGRTADLVRSSTGENPYHDADQCCDADHLPRVVSYVDIGVFAGLTRLGTNLRRAVGQSALGRRKRDFDLRLDARDFRRLHIRNASVKSWTFSMKLLISPLAKSFALRTWPLSTVDSIGNFS